MQIFVANESTKYEQDRKYHFAVFVPFVGFGLLCSPTQATHNIASTKRLIMNKTMSWTMQSSSYHFHKVNEELLGSLSTRVFESRTATGREHLPCQDSGVSQIFTLIISNRTVNKELTRLCNWLMANKLPLNTKKTNFVIFRPYQKRINFDVTIKLLDHDKNSLISLERKDYVRYLSVLIDSNLTWKQHILFISSKISKSLGIGHFRVHVCLLFKASLSAKFL